jgi:hypothetical protein
MRFTPIALAALLTLSSAELRALVIIVAAAFTPCRPK